MAATEPPTLPNQPLATDDLIESVFSSVEADTRVAITQLHTTTVSPSDKSTGGKHLQPAALNPIGPMFHCMISYRVETDQAVARSLHNKLFVVFRNEDAAIPKLQRTLSGSSLAGGADNLSFSGSPVARRGQWAAALQWGNVQPDAAFSPLDDFPFKGESSFPTQHFQQCEEALHSHYHVFLDKTCLKNGEQWQGSGRSGGFIGALLQSLVFVPIISIFHNNGSHFESLPPNTEFSAPWTQFEGALGKLLRLNKQQDNDKCDNVLLEYIIAQVLYEMSKQSTPPLGTTFPCIKIQPLLLGGEQIFRCIGELSDHPHAATNSKAASVLKEAGLCDADLESRLACRSVKSVLIWYSKCVTVDCFLNLFTRLHLGLTRPLRSLQGIKLWELGIEEHFIPQAAKQIVKHSHEALAKIQEHMFQEKARSEMADVAKLKPLASELFDFLSENFIGYYAPILGFHGVHSIRQFSMLDPQMCRDIALQISERGLSNRLSRSHINEFGRLWPVVELSKGVPEAKTLSERLAKFVDKEAHWAAALYSTQAVDILMRKPIFAFVQMAAVAVLIFVGFLLTLSPLKMERTFPPTILRNATVTEKIERYNTSSVVCWVAACFLLLSFCFAWLRSPRSGRVVFALGVLAVFLSQGLVYVVWDPYNSDLCRFRSLEPTPTSASKCIQAYAVSFVELFWDTCIVGIIVYIAPNFYIAETIDYSPTQYWLSIVLIAAFILLLCYTHWKVYHIRRKANDGKDEGMLALEKLWNNVNENEKQEFKSAMEDMGSKLSDCVENWSGVLRVRKIIEIRSGITNIDFVFAMAEIVNTPIHDFFEEVMKECLGQETFGLIPAVHIVRGPVKRPSRAIAKVYRVYRGDVSKLTDVVRCQIVFSSLPQVKKFIEYLHQLHVKSSIDILRIRNRMDAEYDAKNLTAGYRDCNVKVGLAFELDNTSGGVTFKDILRPQNDSTRIGVKKSCFGLGAFVTKELKNCHSDSRRLYFVCELQLILQGCGQSHTTRQSFFTCLKADEESHKRYVQRRDSLAN